MRENKRVTVVAARQPSALCKVPCFKLDVVSRLRSALPAEDVIEEAEVLFAALADRTRLRLLLALADGEELCVCDVAHTLGVSVAVASHHLRKLRDLRILGYRSDGKMAYYSLRQPLAARLVRQATSSRATASGRVRPKVAGRR